jgi:hypothetical protein
MSAADQSSLPSRVVSAVESDLTCPVCLSVITRAQTVMECMHRFCLECISRSLRLGQKECPACRTRCASKRNLREDLRFDALIAAMNFDPEEIELETNRQAEKYLQSEQHQAYTLNLAKAQDRQRKKNRRKDSRFERLLPEITVYLEAEFGRLRPEVRIELRVSRSVPISSLLKLLAKKYRVKNHNFFRFLNAEGGVIPPEQILDSLAHIDEDSHSHLIKPITLKYRLNTDPMTFEQAFNITMAEEIKHKRARDAELADESRKRARFNESSPMLQNYNNQFQPKPVNNELLDLLRRNPNGAVARQLAQQVQPRSPQTNLRPPGFTPYHPTPLKTALPSMFGGQPLPPVRLEIPSLESITKTIDPSATSSMLQYNPRAAVADNLHRGHGQVQAPAVQKAPIPVDLLACIETDSEDERADEDITDSILFSLLGIPYSKFGAVGHLYSEISYPHARIGVKHQSSRRQSVGTRVFSSSVNVIQSLSHSQKSASSSH